MVATDAVIRGAFEEAARMTPPSTPDVLLGRVLGRVLAGEVHGLERRAFAPLVVQLWSETLRDERLAALVDDGYATMRVAWTKLVDAYRSAGILASDVPGDHVARTMIATAQGFIVQEALFGDVRPEVLENGLRGLMSMNPPKIS